MTPLVRCVDPEATLREAADAMHAEGISTLAVLREGEVLGIISERDIVRAVAEKADPESASVSEFMSAHPRYLTVGDSVTSAAHVMLTAGIRHIPVVDECELVGIVSIRDLVTELLGPEHGSLDGALEVEQELAHPGG